MLHLLASDPFPSPDRSDCVETYLPSPQESWQASEGAGWLQALPVPEILSCLIKGLVCCCLQGAHLLRAQQVLIVRLGWTQQDNKTGVS